MIRYRIADARVEQRDEIADGPDGAGIKIGATGDGWALIDTDGRLVWRAGGDQPTALEGGGHDRGVDPPARGRDIYLADDEGMLSIPLDGGPIEREVGGEARSFGQPARPVIVGGEVYGAWLREDVGVLWDSAGGGEVPLQYAAGTLAEARRPVFRVSGSTVILNETRSGWVWTVPDGELVASSQNWSLDERVETESQPSDVQAEVVLDPKPPVAESDAFGVRAGSLATLPVLLNDHDPNEDVLSIDPTSVTGLDPGFGTVTITDSGGRLAVQVAPTASGSTTLSYRVTDGTSEGGLYSDSATVTLSVAPRPGTRDRRGAAPPAAWRSGRRRRSPREARCRFRC